MKQRFIYDSGLPYSQKLHDNLMALKKRVQEDNKACIILVDGGVGEGKTTLAVHMADDYQGSPIDFHKQYGFGGAEFALKLNDSFEAKLPVIIYDEGGDFNKRGALTGFNKNLSRLFDVFRAFKVCVIIVLPNFSVLDEHIFNLKVPRLLVHCYKRTNKSGSLLGYSLKRMMYMKDFMKKNIIKEKAYSRIFPNFHGKFLDLPRERAQKLETICMKGKKGVVSDSILKEQGLINLKEVSKRTGRSHPYCFQLLKKLNIEPDFKREKTGYYPEWVVERIREHTKGDKNDILPK